MYRCLETLYFCNVNGFSFTRYFHFQVNQTKGCGDIEVSMFGNLWFYNVNRVFSESDLIC